MLTQETFVRTMQKHLGLEPTDCQKKLFSKLAGFSLGSVDADILVVTGYAGTGKTTAIAAFVQTLREFKSRYVLLAPTGRAAKVLSSFTGKSAYTIHKHIYRQKSGGVFGEFQLNFNKAHDTFFIVDECSLISTGAEPGGSLFGSGDLLDDLVTFVRGGEGNKLVLIGDKGQLPPIGLDRSPALDVEYMGRYGTVESASLETVVRQAALSGILTNATIVRKQIESGVPGNPEMILDGFKDIERITGGDLIEAVSDAVGRYGLDGIAVICRSNKRANRYNAGIRSTVLMREERLNRGDKLMVVKNCYQFLEDVPQMDFIANGDVATLVRISHFEERYGINFAEAVLEFNDYGDVEVKAKVILDTLTSEQASLSPDKQTELYQGVSEDYSHIKSARKRYEAVREDKYFNALQLKYATAITCHKSQGGQWPCVFIDNPFWQELTLDDLRWLYTAVTRATEKVYLVNFRDEFFKKP